MATDINLTPTAGMPPVTTVTSGGGTSSGSDTIVRSPEAMQALAEQQAAGKAVVAAETAVTPAIAATVEGKAAGIDAEKAQLEASMAERNALIAQRMPHIEAAQKQVKEAEDRYLNHQFYDLLANRSTGDKIMSRIALALTAGANAYLGIPGNELADRLQHDVAMDFERQKIALHSKEQIAKWKKEGVKDLYDKLQMELGALDVKHGKALAAVGKKAEAMALRAGVPEAQARQNVVTAKTAEGEAAKNLEAQQRYERHANSRKDSSSSTQVTSAHGTVKPGSEDVKATTDVDDGIKTLDRLIADIEKHPQAWNEYRGNVEDWKRSEAISKVPVVGQGRAVAQGVGGANVAPEQGLKTAEAKRIHQQQESLNTALAKKMGGVITEGDVARVMTQQSNMALSPKEKLEQLKQFKEDLIARRKAYEGNRGVLPSGAASTNDKDMVTIRNSKGETKKVTRAEARALGAIK